MATLEQLQNAFVRADELGEIEDAKLFAESLSPNERATSLLILALSASLPKRTKFSSTL